MSELPASPESWIAEQEREVVTLQERAAAAINAAQVIMDNQDYMPAKRVELAQASLAKVADQLDGGASTFESRIDGMINQAQRVISEIDVPSADDLQRLAYVRDYLSGSWSDMTPAEIINSFKNLLNPLGGGDKLTIRAYMVYGRQAIEQAARALPDTDKDVSMRLFVRQFNELRRQAEIDLSTGDKRRAHQLLKVMDSKKADQLKRQARRAHSDLKNARVDRHRGVTAASAVIAPIQL